MSDLAPKAQLFPKQPMPFRGAEKANYSVPIMRVGAAGRVDGGAVRVDWPLTIVALEEADSCDPNNQLRVYQVQVGETLAYRAIFTDVAEQHIEPDLRRFIMAVIMMIGVDHADEIKAAIAVEREKAAKAA